MSKYRFVRLSSRLSSPIVLHCVPGAGKSSCIREIIKFDSRFAAYTLGVEDQANLEGVGIQRYSPALPQDKFCLLDEYNLREVPLEGYFAVFGDPLQTTLSLSLRAQFICTESRRFGKCTAALLRELGYSVSSELEDSVQISGLYEVDPVETIIAYEEEVICLLKRHSLEVKSVAEIVGRTFESVTFVTSHSVIPEGDRAIVFQCLTRHRRNLLILCPDGTYTAS